jgi:N-acyl-L-homoserine lactone synthetase
VKLEEFSGSHVQVSPNITGDGGFRRLSCTVVSVRNAHRYGELYQDFLKARKSVFIDYKSWALPQSDGMEFDQYDTPQSRGVVIHEFGRVLGGVRLLPTSAICGCYSYMLRDAQRGLLESIPDYVLYEKAPVAEHIWEATRLFIARDVPQERRLAIQTRLMLEMARAAREEGATHVIGIVPAIFQRWLGRLGIGALPLGPKLEIGGDRTQAAIMHVDTEAAKQAHEIVVAAGH